MTWMGLTNESLHCLRSQSTYSLWRHDGYGVFLWYGDVTRFAIAFVALHRHAKLERKQVSDA